MNTKTTLDTYTACSIVEGFADFVPTEQQVIEAWQYLHDTKQAYQLQGWYGRTAQELIRRGVIKA